MGGDAVERRRKGQSLLLRQRERRHEAAGSWQRIAIPAAAVSPPTPTAWLRSNSSTRRTSHASATATRRLHANSSPPGRLNMPAGLYHWLSWPVARARVKQGGLRRAHNYSQLMKTIKTRVFNKV